MAPHERRPLVTANEIATGVALGVGIAGALWVALSLAGWRIEDRRCRRQNARDEVPNGVPAEWAGDR